MGSNTANDVLRRCCEEGDVEAARIVFHHVVSSSYGLAIHLARRVCQGDEAGAEDIFQRAALKAFEKRHTFALEGDEPLRAFRAWFLKFVANEARQVRAYHHNSKVHVDIEDTALRSPESANPAFQMANRQLQSRLERAIVQLPERERKAFIMKSQGYAHQDIAEELGVSVAHSRVMLHHAREKLRTLLGEEVGEDDLDPRGM